MRRLLAVFVALSFALPMHSVAQQPRWDAGAMAEFGLLYRSTSLDAQSPIAGAVGLYGEWLMPPHLSHINLGLELRVDAGILAGPRISTGADGPLHAYIGALFGPTHSTYNSGTVIYPPGTTPADDNRYGVTSEGVVGVEADLSAHFRWRIVELTQASFSGIPGSHPFSVQTGLVWHLR
jgi:hypothetical protein